MGIRMASRTTSRLGLTFDIPMHTGHDCFSTATTMEVDICAFIGWLPQADHIKGYYTYFSINEFPPCTNPSTFFDEQGSFSMLRDRISRVAIVPRFSVVMNGNTNKMKSLANRKAFPMGGEPPYMWSRTFMCDRYRRYNKKHKQPPVNSI